METGLDRGPSDAAVVHTNLQTCHILHTKQVNYCYPTTWQYYIYAVYYYRCLQCFDAIGCASGL